MTWGKMWIPCNVPGMAIARPIIFVLVLWVGIQTTIAKHNCVIQQIVPGTVYAKTAACVTAGTVGWAKVAIPKLAHAVPMVHCAQDTAAATMPRKNAPVKLGGVAKIVET